VEHRLLTVTAVVTQRLGVSENSGRFANVSIPFLAKVRASADHPALRFAIGRATTKIDTTVESQVSKSTRLGAPPVFLCQHVRRKYSRRRCRPPAKQHRGVNHFFFFVGPGESEHGNALRSFCKAPSFRCAFNLLHFCGAETDSLALLEAAS
jgi:hypothetical protein